jgi:16S rRNA (adenine1518-N6/adenine1519-N6)-dimethyltransferase
MRAKKRFGQHFLQPQWAEKLVDAIQPRPEDEFLEIGPGPGALTLRLAPRVAHVTAVELDPDMIAALKPTLPANVTLIEADILDADIPALMKGKRTRVAGNLPYNVSSPILFRLLEIHKAGFRLKTEATRTAETSEATRTGKGRGELIDATLMLQREVAERIDAKPGTKDFGVLSIFIQLHADVRRLLTLPPGAFRPAPKVHSSVIRLTFRPPVVRIADDALFESMVRTMFMQRRKTLANALKPFAASLHLDAAEALTRAGIDASRRPETLQLDELARLADVFVSR